MGAGECEKAELVWKGEDLESVFGSAISQHMRLVKSFEASGPWLSRLSCGWIGLELQSALVPIFCLDLRAMVQKKAQGGGGSSNVRIALLPTITTATQGPGKWAGNQGICFLLCLLFTLTGCPSQPGVGDCRHLLIPSASANIYAVPLDARAWSHLGEGVHVCRGREVGPDLAKASIWTVFFPMQNPSMWEVEGE